MAQQEKIDRIANKTAKALVKAIMEEAMADMIEEAKRGIAVQASEALKDFLSKKKGDSVA